MPQQYLSPYLTSQAWIINQFLFMLMLIHRPGVHLIISDCQHTVQVKKKRADLHTLSVGILGLWNFFVCLTAGYWWNETKMEIAQRQLHSKSTFLVTVEIC